MSFVLALCGAKVDDYIELWLDARRISIEHEPLTCAGAKVWRSTSRKSKAGASPPSMPIQAPLLNSSWATRLLRRSYGLGSDGLPLWDGMTSILVRQARPDEEAKWRASRAKAIRHGDVESEDHAKSRSGGYAAGASEISADKIIGALAAT